MVLSEKKSLLLEALIKAFGEGEQYNSGKDCDLYLFKNVKESVFHNLLASVKDILKVEPIENRIDNNKFSFFFCENSVFSIGYFSCDETVRAVFDLCTALPEYKSNENANNPDAVLWQFEVDHSLIDCGMCYIVKASDGSFFVIDSAHTYSVRDCDRLYDFLRERTPEGEKIRIRGWFLSHGHEDHIAQFMNYVRYYTYDTIIEKVYCNFIRNDHRDGGDWFPSNLNYVTNFYNLMAARPDIPVCRLHTGMYFYTDNLRFDVLCSHEDVFPRSNENYNDSSVVIMMSVGGTKVLFPGDAGHEESYILEDRYPDFLKADIVQQAHHGHFGTTCKFYELVGAKVALFPVTQIKFDEELPRQEPNRRSIEIADHYFIASNGLVEIPLPYKSGVFKVYPDETFESFSGVYNLWAYEYTPERKEQLYKEYLARGGKELDEYKDGFR